MRHEWPKHRALDTISWIGSRLIVLLVLRIRDGIIRHGQAIKRRSYVAESSKVSHRSSGDFLAPGSFCFLQS